MDKKAILGTIIIVIAFFGILGSCIGDSEYERAGKEFGSWVNKDPNSWTDTQQDYFNNFMDWADKN